MCSYCQSFDLDANYCPYYDIFYDSYARVNVVIEIMNDRHECFIGKMGERGLLHETCPGPSSARLEVSLYDDYGSSLPLGPNFMVDSSLIGRAEVIDPPLTSLSIVPPSLPGTPRDTTEGVLHLIFSSSPSFSSVHGVRDG